MLPAPSDLPHVGPSGVLPHTTNPMPTWPHTATIETHGGLWFKYRVKRLHGFGIPEKDTSYHRTLKGARKAAERWCRKTAAGTVVEQHGGPLATIPTVPLTEPMGGMPAPDRRA